MKKICFTVLAAILVVFGSNVDAASENTTKVHLKQENVLLKDGKIFVKTKKGLLPIKALHFDERGLYIFKQEILREKRKYYCNFPNCGYVCDTRDDLEVHMWVRHRGFSR